MSGLVQTQIIKVISAWSGSILLTNNVTPYYFSEKVPIMGITSIVEDEYGRMIFGGGAGLSILEEGKFTNYNYADGVGSGTYPQHFA